MWQCINEKHYRKTADCRASKCLRALFVGRTTNVVFAVRFPDDARQTKTHGTHILCRASLGAHDNHKSLPCVFLGTHGNSSTLTFGRPNRAGRPVELTGVNLCRGPWKNARQRQQVCRAFWYGTRQSYSVAVRFTLAHDNVFLKVEFSHLISIFRSQVYYFALYISIM
jgi:hypothetical protein